MNISIYMGRLTHTPELMVKNKDEKQTYWCRFRLAVNRDFSQNEETDFFNCLVFNKKAKYLTDYAKKGSRVLVIGRMQTETYEKKDGTKGYITELWVTDLQVIDYVKKDEPEKPPFEEKKEVSDDIYGRR